MFRSEMKDGGTNFARVETSFEGGKHIVAYTIVPSVCRENGKAWGVEIIATDTVDGHVLAPVMSPKVARKLAQELLRRADEAESLQGQ